MSIVEMMPSVRALSRIEKLQLIQLLAEDLARTEESTTLIPGQSYPLWSPERAYEAADVLLRELESERTRP
jgi:hypothetical protein